MKILAFDVSSRRGSIAFSQAEEVLVSRDWANDRRNSAPFFAELNEIIQAHGPPEKIIVGLGPGSYTGTRIAISAAIGLQMTTKAELFGLPSVSALSMDSRYFAIGDAKRESFFLAEIHNGSLVGQPELFSEDKLRKRLSVTELPIFTSDELPQFNRVQLRFPSAELLSRLSKKTGNLVHVPLAPIYLRSPHFTVPRAAALR